MLSDKQAEIYKQTNGSKEPKDEKTKMIFNLNERKGCSPYQNFTNLPEAWVKIKKMHRAIKFEPKEILKPHIAFNSEKRTNARNDFEKDIFKLLNTALKFMVIENRGNVRAQQKQDSKTKKSIR